MSVADRSPTGPEVTPELIAEASAWLSVLHGPNRNRATERGFTQWLNRSDSHKKAFEDVTEIWEEACALPRHSRVRTSSRPQPPRHFLRYVAPIAALLAGLAVGIYFVMRDAGVTTGIGEQRVLALEDGSRVILNTQTRVVIDFDKKTRRIELKQGEALFEVAKQPDRPFLVIAANRTIRALGTSFAVRRDQDQVAVTLVEGKVTVASASAATGTAAPPPVALTPGERVVFAPEKPLQTDHPPIEKLLAWQQRQVALTDVSLAEAIREMNRYSREPLVAHLPDHRPIRVTGLFRAGDSLSFARAVAGAYQLDVVEQDGEIRLEEK